MIDYNKKPGEKLLKKLYKTKIVDPKISIVTPFYNAMEYFDQTFNSVINQTFVWFEWIIVDDGSDEKNRKFIEEYAAKDARIRVVHKENGGVSNARNTGVEESLCDFIFPLDADDLISDTCLEQLYWALITNEDASWSYSDVAGFQDLEYVWRKNFDASRMKKENLLVVTALIRKKDFEEVGGYKIEKIAYNEDWRFWLEMLAHHKKPVHVNEVLFWYRRHDGRLKEVYADKEKIEFDRRIINEAGKYVDESVKAIEYPIKENPKTFKELEYRRWEEAEDRKEKNVLWIIPWMVVGGADKFNIDAIKGLNDKGYHNYVVSTAASNNEWIDYFWELSEEVYQLPNFLSKYAYPEFISYLIQAKAIDMVIVSNSEEGYWMLPWIRQHHPNVAIIDYVHMEEWYWHGGGHARSSSVARGISDRTLVCNSNTKDLMVNRLNADEESTVTMHIGVDADYFDPSKVESGYLHKMLDLSEEKKIVLFPCRICEQKRPFLMLEIAKRVIKKNTDIVFVVVGDGPDLGALKKAISKANLQHSILCIGTSNEMRACYKDSALILICSLQEGLTLTTYEAMSMGVPVISSDAGGQCDLVSENVGKVVPLEGDITTVHISKNYTDTEIESYSNYVLKLIQNDSYRIKLGENAREKILNGFSIKDMFENFDAHIREIISNEDIGNKRKIIANGLLAMPNMASEYYGNHIRWSLEENGVKVIGPARYLINKAVELPVVGKTILGAGRFIKHKMFKRV